MSKRELALEEAVRMRKTQGGGPAAAIRNAESPDPLPASVVVGIPLSPQRIDPHLVCILDPCSPAAEQYKNLRTGIVRKAAKKSLTTIMLTSPGMDEGKTITSVNLAVAMAEAFDHTVLLVDADLRNPSVHACLGIEATCGLSEYLQGKAKLAQVLFRTGLRGLVVVPAGDRPRNPAELLASERMKELIHELRQRHEEGFILFDTPPVLDASDALSLGRHMDGVLLVIHALHTHPRAAERSTALMRDLPMLGAVLNGMPSYRAGAASFRYHGGGAGGAKEMHRDRNGEDNG